MGNWFRLQIFGHPELILQLRSKYPLVIYKCQNLKNSIVDFRVFSFNMYVFEWIGSVGERMTFDSWASVIIFILNFYTSCRDNSKFWAKNLIICSKLALPIYTFIKNGLGEIFSVNCYSSMKLGEWTIVDQRLFIKSIKESL